MDFCVLNHPSWSHGSLHVYSLVGSLVPGSFGCVCVWGGSLAVWYCCSPMGLQTPSAPSVLSLTPPLGNPVLSPVVGWEHLPVYVSDSDIASQETTITSSCQQYFFPSAIVSGFCVCIWDGSPSRAVSGWPFLQSLLHTPSPYFL